MKRLLSLLAAACLALLMSQAPAQAAAGIGYFTPANLGVSAVALSTSPSFTIRVLGYSQVSVYVVLTRVASTTLKLACTAGPLSTVQASVPVADVNTTTGAITLIASPGFTYAVSASGTFRFLVAPLNDDTLVCALTGASAGVTDLVSAYAWASGSL